MAKFYTNEQESHDEAIADLVHGKMKPMSEATGEAILTVLREQQNTLQNIWRILQRIEL